MYGHVRTLMDTHKHKLTLFLCPFTKNGQFGRTIGAINKLILKCKNEIKNDDKNFNNLSNKINKESNDLKLYETPFKQYLNNKAKDDYNKNNDNNISSSIKEIESNLNKLLCNDDDCTNFN